MKRFFGGQSPTTPIYPSMSGKSMLDINLQDGTLSVCPDFSTSRGHRNGHLLPKFRPSPVSKYAESLRAKNRVIRDSAEREMCKLFPETRISSFRPSKRSQLRIFHAQGQERSAQCLTEYFSVAFAEEGADICVITSAGSMDLLDTEELDRLFGPTGLNVEWKLLAPSLDRYGVTIFAWKRDLASSHEIACDENLAVHEIQRSQHGTAYFAPLVLRPRYAKGHRSRNLLISAIYVRPFNNSEVLRSASLKGLGDYVAKFIAANNIHDVIEVGDYNSIISPGLDIYRSFEQSSADPDKGTAMADRMRRSNLRSCWHTLFPTCPNHSFRYENRGRVTEKNIDHCLFSAALRPVSMSMLNKDSQSRLSSDHRGFSATFQTHHQFNRSGGNFVGAPIRASYFRLKDGSELQWAAAAAELEVIAEPLLRWKFETDEDVHALGLAINRTFLHVVSKHVGFSCVSPKSQSHDPDPLLKQLNKFTQLLKEIIRCVKGIGDPGSLRTALVPLAGNDTELREALAVLDFSDGELMHSLFAKLVARNVEIPVETLARCLPRYRRTNRCKPVQLLHFFLTCTCREKQRRKRILQSSRDRLKTRAAVDEIIAEGRNGHSIFKLAKSVSRPKSDQSISSVEGLPRKVTGDASLSHPPTLSSTSTKRATMRPSSLSSPKLYTAPSDVRKHAPDFHERFQRDAIAAAKKPHEFFGAIDNKLDSEARCRLDAPLSRDEITAAVKRVKAKSSAGRSLVPGRLLRELGPKAIELLLLLFNACFARGIQVRDWNEGLVLAIYKGKGSTAAMENRRPVALLDVICKLYERILHARLEEALENGSLISALQKAFRKGHDCNEAARMVISAFKLANESNEPMMAMFIDLAKAFDTIPVWLIRMALKEHGFSDKFSAAILSLYDGYCVSFITAFGLSRRVMTDRRGEKQGAILSPPLFTLILNPWLRWVEKQPYGAVVNTATNRKFGASAIADDVATLDSTDEGIQALWNGFVSYMNFADLQCNVEKTKLMANAARRASGVPLPALSYNGRPIEWLSLDTSYNYLGHALNATLDWSAQEAKLVGSIKAKCGVIAQLTALSTSEKAKLMASVVSGILGYSSRTFLLSQSCLAAADEAVAAALRAATRSALHCSPIQALELFGLPSARFEMPARHLVALTHATLARDDPYSTQMELRLTAVAARWDDVQFNEAKRARKVLRSPKGHNLFLMSIDELCRTHSGVVPANQLANAFGLTLLAGGRDTSLSAGAMFPPRNPKWAPIKDHILSRDLGSILHQQVVHTLGDIPEGSWLSGASDGSCISGPDNGKQQISAGIALSKVLPKFAKSFWLERSDILPPECCAEDEVETLSSPSSTTRFDLEWPPLGLNSSDSSPLRSPLLPQHVPDTASPGWPSSPAASPSSSSHSQGGHSRTSPYADGRRDYAAEFIADDNELSPSPPLNRWQRPSLPADPHRKEVWFRGITGNGKSVPYTAECLGLISILDLAYRLKINLVLFCDSLSLIMQIKKMQRLQRFPGKRRYARFGILVERITELWSMIESAGLKICMVHVYSHTDDATPKPGQRISENPTDPAALQAKWDRLFRGRWPGLESHTRLAQLALDEMARHSKISDRLQSLLDAGMDVSNSMKDSKRESSEAELAELLLREAEAFTPASIDDKSNAEKTAVMDELMGPTARKWAVNLNRIADKACEGFQSSPAQLGPACPSAPKFAISDHQGIPVQGYLSEILMITVRRLMQSEFAGYSCGQLLSSRNVRAPASVYPLVNGVPSSEKLTRPTWTGRSLGDLNFKLLTNTLAVGSKSGSKSSHGNQLRTGECTFEIPPGLHVDADLRGAVLAEIRRSLGLRVYPDIFPAATPSGVGVLPQQRSCILVRYKPSGISFVRNNSVQPLRKSVHTTTRSVLCSSHLQEIAKHHVVDSSFRETKIGKGAASVTLPTRTAAICLWCLSAFPGAKSLPLATTRHVLSHCPHIGADIASMIFTMNSVALEHGIDRFVPWFSTNAAVDWADGVRPLTLQGEGENRVSSEVGARVRDRARSLRYLGDNDLRKWAENFFRIAVPTDSPELHAWRPEWGDRGAIPDKWPAMITKRTFMEDLLWKRLKVVFLQHKASIWDRYKRLQAFADRELTSEASAKLQLLLPVDLPATKPLVPRDQGTLDRFLTKQAPPVASDSVIDLSEPMDLARTALSDLVLPDSDPESDSEQSPDQGASAEGMSANRLAAFDELDAFTEEIDLVDLLALDSD